MGQGDKQQAASSKQQPPQHQQPADSQLTFESEPSTQKIQKTGEVLPWPVEETPQLDGVAIPAGDDDDDDMGGAAEEVATEGAPASPTASPMRKKKFADQQVLHLQKDAERFRDNLSAVERGEQQRHG